MDLDEESGHRRRGAELEAALLQAAWDDLTENGYGSITFDSVAKRAGTSRAVLYRRWSSKAELVTQALTFVGRSESIDYRDTGSLRGDLIDLLEQANLKRALLSGVIVACMGDYFLETGSSPADLRRELVGGAHSSIDELWARAIERGEVDAATLTDRVRVLAADLYRHDTLMTMRQLPAKAIAEIVDEVVLPLVMTR